MGGCATRMEPVDFDAADGRLTTEHCVARTEPSSKGTSFGIKQKCFSMSGDDYKVKDADGNVLFQVGGNAFSMRDRMVIKDPEGNAICMMQRKLMSLRPMFQVFSYQPNQEGQESTEDVEGVPVYRFAEVEKAMMSFVPEFEYKLYKGNEETEVVFAVKGQFLWAMGMNLLIYRQDDETKTPVATISQQNATAFGGDEYECSVTKNMDLLGVLCIACAADDMVNDK